MTSPGHAVPEVTSDQRRRLEAFADAVATAPLNLVSRADRPRVFELHVVEAVALTSALQPKPGTRLLDLGSGGGFPGVVIAIMCPEVQVTCLDARAKKAAFVAQTARRLELSNVDAVAGRAETLAREAKHRGAFGAVVARAVARAGVVAELARGFLQPQGLLTVVKGPRYRDELEEFHAVLPRLRYRDPVVRAVATAPRESWLLEATAVGAAPDWVPRRDGAPQREPLPR